MDFEFITKESHVISGRIYYGVRLKQVVISSIGSYTLFTLEDFKKKKRDKKTLITQSHDFNMQY